MAPPVPPIAFPKHPPAVVPMAAPASPPAVLEHPGDTINNAIAKAVANHPVLKLFIIYINRCFYWQTQANLCDFSKK
jgi:hypothetical protein